MGIATDILNLRSSKFSSVAMLIAALERYYEASQDKAAYRLFQLEEAADIALTNIAAHAAEAMTALQPTAGRTARVSSMRRKHRRFNSGPSSLQRPLFAAAGGVVS
jgi:hypothetical protein